jgi:hypothetical protein
MSEWKELDEPLTGGCQCGAVRYRVGVQPSNVHLCHCLAIQA